jgi:hypothetical protein
MNTELNLGVIISQSGIFPEPIHCSTQFTTFSVYDSGVMEGAAVSRAGCSFEPHESFAAVFFTCFCRAKDYAEIGLR